MSIESSAVPAPGLRERTRRAVRAELTAVALDLFLQRGFEATTVDEIAAAAGISRRSLFRYFASKEAIIFDNLQDVGETLAEALAKRPYDEDAWVALRRSFEVVTAYNVDNPERTLAFWRMLEETASLKARHFQQLMSWQQLLVPDISVRLGEAGPAANGNGSGGYPDGEYGPRAPAVVGAALACLDAANHAWLRSQGRADVVQLLDEAMRAVRPAQF
ncbi:TetR family transcriptional regulator [Actinospica sp. MGRD01-02]|uniref:TetR family transcriptional regulator n=1 Tax=Actinospica acidithermotolerans TaxID=2828514 RepID=A0A941E9I1_9ACTN|nr:TetR family transcriptional regulator [Actinospica acidithermotolerans]MBR7827057.1 TetR family transcriptional regulator [Actinospica acidithermotolerans]